MKRIAVIAIIGWLLLAGFTWASEVTNVALNYQDGSTVARIDIKGPVRFVHQTEVPKDGRPDRVIVDVLSATHALGAKAFLNLPACVVTGIRSSQYAVSPEKIVRIVFDLGTTPLYQIDSDDHSITLKFSHKEPSSFTSWSSNSGSAGASPATADLPVIEKPAALSITPATVAARNEIIEKDRVESLSTAASQKPRVETPASKADEATPLEAPIAKNLSGLAFSEDWGSPQVWKPKDFTAFPSAIPQVEPQAVAPAPAPVPTSVVVAESEPVEPDVTAPTPEEQKIVEQPEVVPEAEQHQETLAVAQPEAVSAEQPGNEEPDFPPMETFDFPVQDFPATSPMTASVDDEPVATATPQPQVTQPAPTNDSAEPTPEAVSVKPVETPVQNDTNEAGPTAATGEEKANILDEADFKPAVELPATVKPEDLNKIAAVDDSTFKSDENAQRTTSRFRRDVQSDKIRGTMVAEFPQRLVIQYQAQDQRDPFDPLIDDSKNFNSPVENRIPNVEGLKLVGILESESGNNRALFEDKGGFSYILQSGDKVRNGYVLRVELDQVYFQIFEYGWSRTVALTMEY